MKAAIIWVLIAFMVTGLIYYTPEYVEYASLHVLGNLTVDGYIYGHLNYSWIDNAPSLFDASLLWTNATNQDARIKASEDDISVIEDNLTSAQNNVTDLYANASGQQGQLHTPYTGSIGGNVQSPYMNESWANVTIDNRLMPVFFNATLVEIVVGTAIGALTNTEHLDGGYDDMTYNITEASGSPGLDVRFNYSNVDRISGEIIRYKTSTLVGNYPVIQLWDYDKGVWEDGYSQIAYSSVFAGINEGVYDGSRHVSGGVVMMRFYKATNGNINNKYYFDWLAVQKGPAIPSGSETDPYWTLEKANVFDNMTLLTPYQGSTTNTDLGSYSLTTTNLTVNASGGRGCMTHNGTHLRLIGGC